MNKVLSIMGIVAVLLFVTVQYAHAEEDIFAINGKNDHNGIFLAKQGNENIVILYSDNGWFVHLESTEKQYKSGGFSLKNPDTKMKLWAFPTGSDEWKVTVYVNHGFQRYITHVIDLGEEGQQMSDRTPIVRIEPKSSVGADITKYDIPTTGRGSANLDPMILTLKPQLIPDLFRLGDDFEWSASVINARQGNTAKIENATVTFEISRDGFVLRSYSDETNSGGMVRFQMEEIDYPEFYPEYCYDVKVTTSYENKTSVFNEDFVMQYTLGTKIWEPNTSWMGLNQWNHLPTEYRQEPRPLVNGDEHCNE